MKSHTPAAEPARARQVVLLITGDDVVVNNRILRPGELVEVPEEFGHQLVAERRAGYLHRVEILAEGVILNRRVFAPGDVATCTEADALRLHEHGLGRVLDPSKISGPLPRVRPRPRREAEPPKPVVDPIECRLLRPMLFGARNLEPGDRIIVTRPLAEYFAEAGAVEITGGRLSLPFVQAREGVNG